MTEKEILKAGELNPRCGQKPVKENLVLCAFGAWQCNSQKYFRAARIFRSAEVVTRLECYTEESFVRGNIFCGRHVQVAPFQGLPAILDPPSSTLLGCGSAALRLLVAIK